MKKSSPGFTMLELIVAIAAGALVMAAALSFFMLGTRMERRSLDTAENQQTARIVLTMTEKMAISGDIEKIDKIGESWVLYSTENKPLLQYLSADGSLRLGNSILMRNLQSATATFDENNPKLFTLTLTTEYDSFSTTVYCRNGKIAQSTVKYENLLMETETELETQENNGNSRMEFLLTLCNQYGSTGNILYKDSEGNIRDSDAEEPGYFSEWYIKQQKSDYSFGEENGWNKFTPWCACFLSWGMEINKGSLSIVPYFANVDEGLYRFNSEFNPTPQEPPLEPYGTWLERSSIPLPGDIVFFSWDGDGDPEHVGVVLHVDGDNIYTIEGNSSGRVTVNRYPLTSDDIMGYGVLAWQ